MRALLWLLAWLTLGAALLLAVLWRSLQAQAGEWAHPVPIPLPFTQRSVTLQVGVPSLIRLLTQPSLAPVLSHRPWQIGRNTYRIAHQADHNNAEAGSTLQIHCSPCWLTHRALADEPLQVPSISLSVQRHGEALQGHWAVGPVQGQWQGRLSQSGLQLQLQLPPTPVAQLYQTVASALPEVQRAHISGTLAVQATGHLPAQRWHIRPELQGFAVHGLGTEALRQLPVLALPERHPLVRAVIATEDQRFHEHPGYDLIEWQALLAHLQPQQRLRGGSTLSQQLAKLLYTQGDRTLLRKLQELLYTMDMEHSLGKARILQLYLSVVPWGAGSHGAAEAAQEHLGRSLQALTPAEAIWLAAMLHQPNAQLRRWQHTGTVDMPRTLWIARQMHATRSGLTQRQLQAAEQQLSALRPRGWIEPAAPMPSPPATEP